MKAVIGLGNPGKAYTHNRHNCGFMALDAFCREKKLVFEKKSRFKALVADYRAEGETHVLVKPSTYMNASGDAVSLILGFYKLQPGDMLVVCDDFQLPLGMLRLREKGSSGGHNGLESIIRATGTPAFPRLRMGVGTEAFRELKARGASPETGFVLGDFAGDEKDGLDQAIAKASGAIELFLAGDLRRAMSLYNVRPGTRDAAEDLDVEDKEEKD
jgi:PTH1 family peptidyl-tRNA hydrolase